MLNNMGITGGSTAKYILLPEVFPRLKKLFGTGFFNLPYFIIVLFNTLKIIPDNHIYLSRQSHGRFSTVQAIAAAANHLTFTWKNADKVSIFFLVLAGLAMMILQFILLIVAIFALPAYAAAGPGTGPTTTAGFFANPNPTDDIAFRLLDLVFGIPGIFFSKDMASPPSPFHTGLHALFQFYSFGMLIVGTIVIVYLTIAIVMETAESGVPFGKRFNKSWAPIRIVLFFGLLLPTPPYGINLGQYILLNAAKLGSNVATNAWITFENTSRAPYLANADQLVARPQTPDLRSFIHYMQIARTCSIAEGRINGRDIQPYFVFGRTSANGVNIVGGAPAFSTMVQNASGGTITIRFGEQSDTAYPDEDGAVYPYCGELTLPIVDQGQPGAARIQQAYIESILCLWDGINGTAMTCYHPGFTQEARDYTDRYSRILPYVTPPPNMQTYIWDAAKISNYITMNIAWEEVIDNAVLDQVNNGNWTNQNPQGGVITDLGWAGAGIWFNKIAEQNGALAAAAFSTPVVKKMPDAMEFIKRQKEVEDSNTSPDENYTPTLSSGKMIIFEKPQEIEVARVLLPQFNFLNSDRSVSWFTDTPESENNNTTGNVIIDTINMMMGTQGLFDLCRNANIHPLAQLASLGRGLVEHSIRSFGMAAAFGVGAGVLTILKKATFAESLRAASSFFITVASIGLILGFILYYVLPFLPFVYFFFAVMTWIKAIFEAMVGMPLWALAHLKIDGEGMPGDSAASGYFYILEIFLRPIVIIVGFLASIIIFGAMVKVLNQIFYLAISNVTGHAVNSLSPTGCFNAPGTNTNADNATEAIYKMGPIDAFFFSVIYAIIVYMIGTSCFKLVDIIPDNITRWLGIGIKSFGATDGDDAQGMVRYIAIGAGNTGNQLKNGVAGFGFFN